VVLAAITAVLDGHQRPRGRAYPGGFKRVVGCGGFLILWPGWSCPSWTAATSLGSMVLSRPAGPVQRRSGAGRLRGPGRGWYWTHKVRSRESAICIRASGRPRQLAAHSPWGHRAIREGCPRSSGPFPAIIDDVLM